jgi:co-chaperonin GroES (HSP10)
MSESKLDFNIGDVYLKLEIPQMEACYPGFEPSEYNLIVAPGKPSKFVGKSKLIMVADETQDQLAMAVQVGRVVDASPLAFNYAKWPDDRPPPQIGDVVLFAKYAGGVFAGADGREYRMVKDRDITGVIPPIDEVKLALAKALSKEDETPVATKVA